MGWSIHQRFEKALHKSPTIIKTECRQCHWYCFTKDIWLPPTPKRAVHQLYQSIKYWNFRIHTCRHWKNFSSWVWNEKISRVWRNTEATIHCRSKEYVISIFVTLFRSLSIVDEFCYVHLSVFMYLDLRSLTIKGQLSLLLFRIPVGITATTLQSLWILHGICLMPNLNSLCIHDATVWLKYCNNFTIGMELF